MKDMLSVIDCRQVAFKYNSIYALKEFNLRVERGEIVALLGPNGAGKTTSIRVMNGLLAPEGGEMQVLGMDPRLESEKIRARTGVLTETPALYERLTARENLNFFGTLSGIPGSELEDRVNRMLGIFNLIDRANDRVESFSKGMKQRLALARALLHNPELIFLDEPTSDLDPEAAKQVQDQILEIGAEGKRTVILCTHRLVEAEKLCDRVAILKNGFIAAIGTLNELREQVNSTLQVNVSLVGNIEKNLLALVAKCEGISSVQFLPGGILNFVAEMEEQIPAVVSILVNNWAAIKAVEPRRATLEEIYMHLQHSDKEVQA